LIPSQPATTSLKPLAEVQVEGELSPFEDEKIYRILREKFKLQHPSYSHLDSEELATRVNIVFHQPYSNLFFTSLLQEGWRDLKEILKEIRHRRGNAGAGYTVTFKNNETGLVFTSGVLEDREFRSSLDQISYLTSIIGQMLRPEAMEKPLTTVETNFDKRSDRWTWFRGFTQANEGYVFDEAVFRWVKS
jgi:hypothetical protein